MPKLSEMKTSRLPLTGGKTATPLSQLRAGMPALDSIRTTLELQPKPQGPSYRILRTAEVDNYEINPAAAALTKLTKTKGAVAAADIAAAAKRKVSTGDDYAGKDRKASKLSVGTGSTEDFADLSDLIASLTPDDSMINHQPRISIAATSKRTSEEQRNVSVSAFLYASSRESDNDFHLIVGRDANATPEAYMTMEVSGLPPSSSPAFAPLNAARGAFKNFFGNQLPGAGYDFYDPPIPVQIEGSLFFDMTHASGTRPGPQSLKSRMPTIWEVHPLTSITLGP